jgi:hypothetical protein
MKYFRGEFGVFLWHTKNNSKERLTFFTDNLRGAINIANEKSYLTNDKIMIRKFNRETEVYDLIISL